MAPVYFAGDWSTVFVDADVRGCEWSSTPANHNSSLLTYEWRKQQTYVHLRQSLIQLKEPPTARSSSVAHMPVSWWVPAYHRAATLQEGMHTGYPGRNSRCMLCLHVPGRYAFPAHKQRVRVALHNAPAGAPGGRLPFSHTGRVRANILSTEAYKPPPL